ncbi:hypothetical protein B4U79_06969 [Dinothrombium tinctorium]|uniref:Ku domain-containing protein n=1 Tax=Dinothrombium tinctorium TaxID=1965070 RepID=A0A443QF35_9ACAR|nr:hypothetical protein B4U79_06969 [Dinothrombium tinctorium]
MFDKFESTTAFHLAAQSIRNFIANVAISDSSDLIAVILAGTQRTDNSSDFKHIFVLKTLQQASAEFVLLFDDKILKMDHETFKTLYGHSENYSLGEVFWLCSVLFNEGKTKLSTKSVLFFTNKDDPYSADKVKRTQSVVRSGDLKTFGVDIDVIPLTNLKFDFEKFYNEIVTNPVLDEQIYIKPEQLLKRIRMKSHKRRVFATVPFVLGPDVKISVGVYVLVRETRKPFTIKFDRRTNKELKSETNLYAKETDDLVDKKKVVKSVEYAGTSIYFSTEELKAIKDQEIGLTLLGFKPMTCLQPHYHKKPTYFIVPNEETIKGSNCLFNALLTQCHKRDVFAVCRCLFRNTSSISLVALIPQIKIENEQPGFHVVVLPFSEDIREPNLIAAQPVTINERLIDKAKDIIKALKRDFNPDMIKNPALQKFYAHIEALALRLSSADEGKDDLKADTHSIDNILKRNLPEFEQYLPKASKPLPQATNENKIKFFRVKKEENFDVDDLREAAEKNQLGKLTVKVLKEFCGRKGINSNATRKADLISAIKEYYNIQ